jgi:hypothetical protein
VNEEAEEPLAGGRLTTGVVRLGDTVRRPRSASSAFVATLLLHCERVGFTGGPRFLGVDEAGRDTLTFVPGCVSSFKKFEPSQIRKAATLLRAFHDATRGTTLAGTKPVVCHNDLGPNNTVFQNGMPIAFIDFDFAAPGEPLEDVGYMAWLWCVSSKVEIRALDIQVAQVCEMGVAYGLNGHERSSLIDAMIERQTRNERFWASKRTKFDGPPTPLDVIEARVTWSIREREHVERHRQQFNDALARV